MKMGGLAGGGGEGTGGEENLDGGGGGGGDLPEAAVKTELIMDWLEDQDVATAEAVLRNSILINEFAMKSSWH